MKVSRILLLCGTALLLCGGAAQAQEACTTYKVQPGDNLRRIANKAYGDSDLYRRIYDANIKVIGAKADLIEIGAMLVIPCAETAAEAPAAAPAEAPFEAQPESVIPVSATPETLPAAPAPAERPIAFVTGNGYAPFADKSLPGGGMMTQLVEMAIFRADPAIPYNLSFVSDWQAHIDALLPSGAYDLSFPWIRPDCESGMLSPGDQVRCNDFAFSGPFYEIVDAYFATRDSGLLGATSYAEFERKRICRPEGFTAGVLEAAGLTASTVTLVRGENVKECFRALAAGEVDLVSVDSEVGDATIAKLGLISTIGQNPHLSTILSLHVIAHKSNPRAVAMLGKLDAGVIEMYESGEWYDIVSTALSKQRQAE
ncbi:transporter substrate-binding domain-containing protein [Rhodobacter calidifons]|uniref:Transporter substrate-binding domain-containing protein n=1 Tax=Rhodobacter calidifons TaxID=2715277 RepID=A0ABX0G9I4_9RHOB|nr:transporter substrate-binding domain-containing protein [Rhodobacter calidifons]NHB77920.1 transporter substrate-binding domain-containing protein [Rhodobacter calidifons]